MTFGRLKNQKVRKKINVCKGMAIIKCQHEKIISINFDSGYKYFVKNCGTAHCK